MLSETSFQPLWREIESVPLKSTMPTEALSLSSWDENLMVADEVEIMLNVRLPTRMHWFDWRISEVLPECVTS